MFKSSVIWLSGNAEVRTSSQLLGTNESAFKNIGREMPTELQHRESCSSICAAVLSLVEHNAAQGRCSPQQHEGDDTWLKVDAELGVVRISGREQHLPDMALVC